MRDRGRGRADLLEPLQIEVALRELASELQDARRSNAHMAAAEPDSVAGAIIDAEHRLRAQMAVLCGATRMLRDRSDDLTDAQRAQCYESMARSADLVWREIEQITLRAHGVRDRSTLDVDPASSPQVPRRSMSVHPVTAR